MDQEQGYSREGNDFQEILGRFENMIEHDLSFFFDVDDFERIIDHYLDSNHFSKAFNAVTYGIRLHPGSINLLIKKAQVYAEKGESQKALDVVNSLELLDHSNVELYMLKGMILNQLGRISEAEKTFEKALDFNYENEAELLYDIAISFENINQFRLALPYLEKAHRKKPDRLNILYDLAYCYDRLHDFEKSIKNYRAYLDLHPYSEHVWFNLGLLYFKKEDFRKAVECYDFALAVNEKYAIALFNKANALANLENFPGAVQSYKDCIDLEPDNVLAHCYIGESLEKMQHYEEAIEWYKKATHIDPLFSEAWYGAAICYLFRKSYQDSLFYVTKAIALDEDNPDFWFTLGNIHDHLGSYPDAAKAYARTTRLDPYDDEAWISLSRLEYKQGHLGKAIQVLKDSYPHTFDVYTVNFYLSGYYYLAGNMAFAVKFFEKGIMQNYAGHSLPEHISPGLLQEKAILEILKKYDPSKKLI